MTETKLLILSCLNRFWCFKIQNAKQKLLRNYYPEIINKNTTMYQIYFFFRYIAIMDIPDIRYGRREWRRTIKYEIFLLTR